MTREEIPGEITALLTRIMELAKEKNESEMNLAREEKEAE